MPPKNLAPQININPPAEKAERSPAPSPAYLGLGPSPRIQSGSSVGECPSPTMFPIFEEIHPGSHPRFSECEVDDVTYPTPNIQDIRAENPSPAPPPFEPLSPFIAPPESPRLSEEDAQNINIWFWRDRTNDPELERGSGDSGELRKWRLGIEDDDENFLALTPTIQ